MTIRHFRIFIVVASTESITKAAQLLYVTQPTVSVAIREMEHVFSTGLIKDYTLQKKERHY